MVANVWPLKIWIPAVSVVVVGLLAWLLGGSPLLWSVLAGAVVLALLCGLVGWGLLWLLKRLTLKALPLRLAVNRLLRQPWSTLSQLAAFSLSFMLLALLLVLRGDLLDRWQQQLPPQSPNYFLINIAPEQIVPVKTFLAEPPDAGGGILSDRPGPSDADQRSIHGRKQRRSAESRA